MRYAGTPVKLSGEPLSNSRQAVQAEARSSVNDHFVNTPEITISRYAGF
jgi:hypothetical protein